MFSSIFGNFSCAQLSAIADALLRQETIDGNKQNSEKDEKYKESKSVCDSKECTDYSKRLRDSANEEIAIEKKEKDIDPAEENNNEKNDSKEGTNNYWISSLRCRLYGSHPPANVLQTKSEVSSFHAKILDPKSS